MIRRPPAAPRPADLFDELAPRWDDLYRSRPDFGVRQQAAGALLTAILDGYDRPRVLDLGGGTGVFAAIAAPRADQVVVVDRSERMMRAGLGPGAAPGNVSPVVADAASVPAPDGRFDVIVCIAVLEWLDDLDGAMAEIGRLVAPGGLVLFSVPRPRSLVRRLERLADLAAPLGRLAGARWAPSRRYAAARPHGSSPPWGEALARHRLEVVSCQDLAFGSDGWRAALHPNQLVVARPSPAAAESGTSRRHRSEARFHDDAYTHQSRRAVAPFYRVLEDCRDRYLETLAAGTGPGTRVLELGCGPGQTAAALARAGAEVHAIDLSEVVVGAAHAAGVAEGVTIHHQRMDGEQLAFRDGMFDLVYGSGVLHHLDLSDALAEIRRVLKPGGRAVFMEPFGHNPIVNAFRRATPSLRTPDEHPLLLSDVAAMSATFGRVDTEYFALTSLLALPVVGTGLAPWLLLRLGRLDRLVFDRWPSARGWAWYGLLTLSGSAGSATLSDHVAQQV